MAVGYVDTFEDAVEKVVVSVDTLEAAVEKTVVGIGNLEAVVAKVEVFVVGTLHVAD